ncbi:MAG: hypothetical protein HY723_01670 [Chloroflexi bacterium]|nr:hypothetical protein [Chloroflexota bacterium]
MIKRLLVVLLLTSAAGALTLFPSAPSLEASHCPLSGSYRVQGTLPDGSGNSLELKIGGKFINSGVDGCFTSGDGTYKLSPTRGKVAVHTDWTTWWSTTTGLFLPAVATTGGLAGQELVIIACLDDGNLAVPAQYPNSGDVYTPGTGPEASFVCQAGEVSVWFIEITLGCEDCWDETSGADFAGPGTVTLR